MITLFVSSLDSRIFPIFAIGIKKNFNKKPWTKPTSFEMNHNITNFLKQKYNWKSEKKPKAVYVFYEAMNYITHEAL